MGDMFAKMLGPRGDAPTVLGSSSDSAPAKVKMFGGIGHRSASESEMDFFKKNPHVAGYAADDDVVVLNPNSSLSNAEREAVVLNESARVAMRKGKKPTFGLTSEQQKRFATYGDADAQKATVAARILSGDPSAGIATPEQTDFVQGLRKAMGLEQ